MPTTQCLYLPVVVAALVWGQEWRGQTVLARCDNSAAFAIVNSGSSNNPCNCDTAWRTYVAATREFVIKATHIRGVGNVAADALSRNDLPSFCACYPQAEGQGTTIPLEVFDVILPVEPNWMERDCMIVEHYCKQALTQSTQQFYNSAKRRYAQFCTRYTIPLLLQEETLCCFVTLLARENISHSSAKCYLAALHHLQIKQEMGDSQISAMPKLDLVLHGIKRTQSQTGKTRIRLPITPQLLHKMKEV